ncbi:MAG: hypothetical protein NZM38_02770 [Cytophagales bacterium]|nr:hypothetical protein [Cytophagales bacterium]MDW8383676.1 hypothetical protein [Flammeovirgaceae bacterium]
MAKLKHIIKQLSQQDYENIYEQLVKSSADKSALLLKVLREKHHNDAKLMEELDVNTNAYYTLRSRLNQKIEEYLLQQMESPRTDLLKKVANINEVIFTKKKAISIATLKKLEKELLDYDLSNELTIIYKTLKRLHIHSPEYYHYSQMYNKHVSCMLAIDKAEDILAEYFKKYGLYTLSGDPNERAELGMLAQEIENIARLYTSHRLFVYQNCLTVFHRLFVEPEDVVGDNQEPIEDILNKIEQIFEQYYLDSVYFHLRLVVEFLRLEYYTHYKVYRKAEKYFEEINQDIALLLSNYTLYTFPAQFLQTKLERSIRLNIAHELYEECERVFEEIELDKEDVPRYLNYVMFRALACYYAEKYDEAARWINNLINEMTLKKYPLAMLDIKCILALQYCLMRDNDLFAQLMSSIQRQIRLMGKEECEDIFLFTKILKIAVSEVKRDKPQKIKGYANRLQNLQRKRGFNPIRFIVIDDKLIQKLCHE